MNREEARKLLGGYATGTLTAAEREALFSAALEDQQLFDELMKEEPLREVLDDPALRSAVLAALEEEPVRRSWWSWRPLVGAVAIAGLVLAAVAYWRGQQRVPQSVITAELRDQRQPLTKPAAPAAVPPPARVPAPTAEMKRAASIPKSRIVVPQKSHGALEKSDDAAGSLAKDVVITPAQPPKEVAAETRAEVVLDKTDLRAASGAPAQNAPQPPAPLPPAPRFQQEQQVGQIAPSAPSVAEAAPAALNQTAARSGFRASPAPAAFAAKKSLDVLQWTLLRGTNEATPGTTLDAGEAVRLRITSYLAGSVTLADGDQVLASSRIRAGQPLDTDPIPGAGAGERKLKLTLKPSAGAPITLDVVLTYK